MTTPKDELFANLENILTAESQRINAEQASFNEAAEKMAKVFSLTLRQARLGVAIMNNHLTVQAERVGVPAQDYVDGMPDNIRFSVTAFAAGYICGHDRALNLDPETGLPQ